MKLIQLVSLSSLFCLSASIISPIYAQTSTTETNISQQQLDPEDRSKQSKNLLVERKAIQASELFFNQNFFRFKQMIHPDIRNEVTIELLKQEYSEIVSTTGAFKRIKGIQVIDSLDTDIAIITIQFANLTEDWTIIFDEKQQMLGTDFLVSRGINEIALEFIESLSEGKYDYARSYLHPFLKEQVFPQDVKSTWQKMEQQYGKYQKIVDSNIRVGSSLEKVDLVFVDVEFGNEIHNILFSFDCNKKITNVDIFQN